MNITCEQKIIFVGFLQICGLVSKYIMAKKEQFFDLRNIRIVMVKNDPLGKAFNLDYFHRTQVT